MKQMLTKFACLIAAVSIFSSCDKNDDNTTPAQAKVMVVHASPNAPNVDVRINDNIALTNVAFLANSAYTSVNSGATNIKVSPTTTTTYVINANVTLEANKNYSVFAVDSVSKIKAAVTVDDLTAPAAGKAHVRFLHLSPNAPAVDIAVTGGSVLFPNRTFNDQSANAALYAFTPLNAGTYNLEVRVAGTLTVALALPNITLTAGKIYTIYAKGFLGGTGGQALGAQIIANN
ncbi:MAG: DUF4397 domain-containing protein [Chitinophagaceae bacterium]|nr:DUF4397 domain-containing protein [Chitinophagaceae bacterium]